MEKEFIPYEQALALKELGFNRRTIAQYNTRQGNEWILTLDLSGEGQYTGSGGPCVAPTFSQAFRWFREKYNLHSVFEHDSDNYYYAIQGINDIKFDTIDASEEGIVYKTYEEAELECLNKLIEIVKEK